MKSFVLAILFLSFAPAFAIAQDHLNKKQLKLIYNNVPDEPDLTILRHDAVANYFAKLGYVNATHVQVDPFNDGPFQIGRNYPRYFVWGSVYVGLKCVEDGFFETASIGRTHFKVIRFLPAQSIRSNEAELSAIIPVKNKEDVVSAVLITEVRAAAHGHDSQQCVQADVHKKP